MDRAVMIPVKDLSNAKERLAPILSPDERKELAWLMLTGVMEAVAGLPKSWGKVIVTSYEPAKALAGRMHFQVLSESRQISESDSVDSASAQLQDGGVEGVLRVPLDLPLIAREDLERVLTVAEEGYAAVLVPSFDGTGTNALYRSPPTLFPSCFGENSLALHRQHAERLGARFTVEEVPSLALDIDTAGDLDELLNTGLACPVRDYLLKIDVQARLTEAALNGHGEFPAAQKR